MAENNKEHFRHIMLFYFRKGKNASQTTKKICAVYGNDAVNDSTCRKWFRKFRQKNFNLNDAPRSGRPTEVDGNDILAVIESDQNTTTREIGQILGISQSTVSRRLSQLDMEPQKKYFKRGELLKQEEEEYWQKHQEKYQYMFKNQNEDQSSSNKADSSKDETILPRKEVIRRLRERIEPILLYGESENEAFQRLRRLELLEPEIDRGFRNDFQEALEKVDQAYLDEIMKSQGQSNEGKSMNDVKVEAETVTMEEIMEEAKERLGKGNDNDDAKIILKFLKFLLQLWGQKLNSRLENEKTCMKGKLDSATYSQTQEYIRPLFRRLKKENVPEDILEHLVLIVNYLLERNYVKANDAYLQMAIGNAPWPIGVTMVGIHARTGREKIFSRNIAHVLNDETQRKFIQALKRLMTQCQRFFPTDPSRSVEYNA